MKKAVIVAATAALLAGSAIAHAAGPADAAAPQSTQQAAPPAASPAAPPAAGSRQQAAFEANLATLKSGLKLTADQEKLWPAFETAMRNTAQERAGRMAEARARRDAARQAGQGRPARPDMVERMRFAAERMTTNGTEMRQIADTLEPLYTSFDPTQKAFFEQTVRGDLRTFFGIPYPRKGDRPRRN